MEKDAEEIRTIIRDCGEDLLEMWKKFSNTLVRTRGVDYVARIYEYPWRKVAGEGELLEMVRDYTGPLRRQ